MAFSRIACASSLGTSPKAAHASVARISTSNQEAYLFSCDQICPISGRVYLGIITFSFIARAQFLYATIISHASFLAVIIFRKKKKTSPNIESQIGLISVIFMANGDGGHDRDHDHSPILPSINQGGQLLVGLKLPSLAGQHCLKYLHKWLNIRRPLHIGRAH